MMTGDEYRRQLQKENNRVCTSDYIPLHLENRTMWFIRRNTGHYYHLQKQNHEEIATCSTSSLAPGLQLVLILHRESKQ